MYISTISIQGLILNMPNNQPKWKDKYFYIGGNIWGGEPVALVHATWNQNFDTTMPWGKEMLTHHGSDDNEKVYCLKLQNSLYMTYKQNLTLPNFKTSRVWKSYPMEPPSWYTGYFILSFINLNTYHMFLFFRYGFHEH